jgi:hypothetical protein
MTRDDDSKSLEVIERTEILEALAESATPINAGKAHDAGQAVGTLLDELKAR